MKVPLDDVTNSLPMHNEMLPDDYQLTNQHLADAAIRPRRPQPALRTTGDGAGELIRKRIRAENNDRLGY